MTPGAIFVFGSNEAGIHGRGAAHHAKTYYGAIWGQGNGRQGMSYAIPTKDAALRVLPLSQIREYFAEFVEYARLTPGMIFILTPIGTGLAGYSKSRVTNMVREFTLSDNVVLSHTWITD